MFTVILFNETCFANGGGFAAAVMAMSLGDFVDCSVVHVEFL